MTICSSLQEENSLQLNNEVQLVVTIQGLKISRALGNADSWIPLYPQVNTQ